MKKHSKYILIICVALGVGLGTNLAHPVTPYLIKEANWPEMAFSYFFALMSLGMLIFAPIWGIIGDRFGKRLVLLICCIGYSIGQVMFASFQNLYLVYFARFFSGCFSGGINVALVSYLASSKDLKKYDKARLIPVVLSLQLVGNSFGNFLGGFLGGIIQYRSVLYVQAIFLTLFGIVVYLFFNMKDEEYEIKEHKNALANLVNIKKIGLWNLIFLLCLTGFSLVFTNAQKYLDYYYSDLGMTSSELGSLNLVIGILTLATNVLVTPYLLKKLKQIPTCILLSIVGAISLTVTFIPKDGSVLLVFIYTFFMIYVISKSIIESASASFISENKAIKPGLILGVRQSFLSLGAVIGPILGGLIYYSQDIENRVILFYICAILYFISGIVLLLIYLLRNKFKPNLYELIDKNYDFEAVEENDKYFIGNANGIKCYSFGNSKRSCAVLKYKNEYVLILGENITKNYLKSLFANAKILM